MGIRVFQHQRKVGIPLFKVLTGILFIGYLAGCGGQIGDILNDAEVKIPRLDRLGSEKPVITTGIDNALTQLPFLDDFNPVVFSSLGEMRRGPHNGFMLDHPGAFAAECRSYCLHSGTYGPTKGDGFAYAPLQGPGAPLIRSVLQKSVDHPEIPQRHVQLLIWAILSRTRITDMSPDMQEAAAVLLSDNERDYIIDTALEEVRQEVWHEILANLPEAARRVMEAEANLRSLLTDARATYEEIERVAVLSGMPDKSDPRNEVPRGRWSYHPDGYFIRYFPQGYNHMRLEVSHPEPYLIERDGRQRILSVRNGWGDRIEIAYRDDPPAGSFSQSADVNAFRIKSVRFVKLDAIGPEIVISRTAQWENPGWTLVGESDDDVRPGAGAAFFPGLMERLNSASRLAPQLDGADLGFRERRSQRAGTDGTDEKRKDLIDLAHLATALEKTIGPTLASKESWVREQALMLKMAWQYTFCAWQGKGMPFLAFRQVEKPSSFNEFGGIFIGVGAGWGGNQDEDPCENPPPPPEDAPELDPTDGVATPGNPDKQRLIPSADDDGPKPPKPDCQQVKDSIKNLEKVRDAYQNNPPLPGEDGNEYDKRIHDMFNLGKQGGAVAPMGTSMNCTIGENKAYYQGKPSAFHEADCVHERVHQAKCRWARDHASGGFDGWTVNPRNVQQNEIDAYNAGIQYLKDWLAQNCK